MILREGPEREGADVYRGNVPGAGHWLAGRRVPGVQGVLGRNEVGAREEYGSYVGEKLSRNIPVCTQI